MEREIVFRGQTRRWGEKVNPKGNKLPGRWVYGGIFPGTGDFSIIYGGKTGPELKKFVVYSETVGQYIGLTDKNEQRIFEGDILEDSLGIRFIVRWDKNNARYLGFTLGKEPKIVYVGREPKAVIIGNAYDNPELMRKEQ